MRRLSVRHESLFGYVSVEVEKRVPERNPLRPMKAMVDAQYCRICQKSSTGCIRGGAGYAATV